MSRPRAFVEAPAGLASVSLRLHGGPHCRPPISRMGNKAGYAEVILAALGLRSGQGAGCYIWGEADPDVRGLLRAYPDAALLRRVAAIIRGWADEEPRALWERLRAERKARGPRVDEEGTAGWMFTSANTTPHADVWKPVPAAAVACGVRANLSADGLSDRCLTLAEYATIVSSNRLIHVADDGTGDLRNAGQGGTTFGGAEFATPAGDVAAAFERVAGEVAGFAVGTAWTRGDGALCVAPGATPEGTNPAISLGGMADRCAVIESRWPPVAVLPTIPTAAELAALLGTPGDLEGVVYYADPPYLNTTGYAHDLPRADVVRQALEAAALGAVVAVSEQEPIPELMAAGWFASRLTEGRRGQRRTFSKQSEEYLTINRQPAHVVASQVAFSFGGAG